MSAFIDGPAKGARLMLGRAPVLLRVVLNQDGLVDALDQLGDEPATDEQITVYILQSSVARAFIDGRDKKGKRWGKLCEMGEYRVFDRQPPDDVARNRESWESWAAENQEHAEQCRRFLLGKSEGGGE